MILDNLTMIMERVEKALALAERKSGEVSVVGISKKQGPDVVREAFEAGVRVFGENYMQEAVTKVLCLKERAIQWHFVGSLQSNKAKNLVNYFSLFHSLDRLSLGKAVAQAAIKINKIQDCLIQVNLEKESSKGGISVAQGPELLQQLQTCKGLRIRGLMAMPPLSSCSATRRKRFAKLRNLAREWEQYIDSDGGHNLYDLSMGTSQDFEEAIIEGATIVRLGTILLGPREMKN